jgi:hypothetical protein
MIPAPTSIIRGIKRASLLHFGFDKKYDLVCLALFAFTLACLTKERYQMC